MEKNAIVKIHPRNFSGKYCKLMARLMVTGFFTEEDLIINLDFFGKPKLQQGNVIQISLQDDHTK